MRFSALRDFFGKPTAPAGLIGPESREQTLLKQRVIVLGSVIDDETAGDIIAKLLYLDQRSRHEPIDLYINSPGGLVLEGLAIIDTFDRLRAPVRTHCVTTAHSMAAVILACGHAGSRFAQAGATVMFTLPQAPAEADPAKQQEALRLGEILIAKTAAATERPIDKIRALFIESTRLSAQEAVHHGIIDHVLPLLTEGSQPPVPATRSYDR